MKHSPNFLFPTERRTMQYILFKVCEGLHVNFLEVLYSERGSSKACEARQIGMYAIRDQLGASYPSIGAFFQRDHATIMHGVDKVGDNFILLSKYAILRHSLGGDKVCGKPVISRGKKLEVENLSPKSTHIPLVIHSEVGIESPYIF